MLRIFSITALCALLSGCFAVVAIPNTEEVSKQQQLDQHVAAVSVQPKNNAVAFGIVSDTKWVSAGTYNEGSVALAKANAVFECNIKATGSGVGGPCKIYAVNGVVQ